MKIVLKLIVCLAILAGLTYGGMRTYRAMQERRASRAAEDISAVKVRVQPVARGTIQEVLTLTGDLEPLAAVEVIPKISGRLDRLSLDDGTAIEEGVEVKKGELMAVIEHDGLAADVEQAEAALEVARASLSRALVMEKNQKREKVRMENLFEQGAATERQRDQAVTDYDKAVAEVDLAKAQISQAEAALRKAKTDLSDAFIHAPIGGVMCRKNVDVGDMLTESSVIVCIVDIERLKLFVDVPSVHLPKIVPGKTSAIIRVEAYPKREFPATVEKVHPILQRETRTARVEIHLKNPREGKEGWVGYMLRPGMYASVEILLASKEGVIVAPADSLIRHIDVYYAFVVEGDRAERVTVTTGLWTRNLVEVKKGLEEGQLLVVRGQDRLTDGAAVEVVGEETSG